MEIVITSILAFVSTNIDDIFILRLFFGNKEYKTKEIVIGQYLGIVALIGISLVCSLIGLLFDQKYIGFLGLLPGYFGIRDLFRLRSSLHAEQKEKVTIKESNRTFTVAAVTFANGGDNIGIYIPLFATLLIHEKIGMILIFLIMVAIWCLAAMYISKYPFVGKVIKRFGHIIAPIVLIILGIYILYDSGSFKLLL